MGPASALRPLLGRAPRIHYQGFNRLSWLKIPTALFLSSPHPLCHLDLYGSLFLGPAASRLTVLIHPRPENLEHVTLLFHLEMKPLHVALNSPPNLSAHPPRPKALICLLSAESVGLLVSVLMLLSKCSSSSAGRTSQVRADLDMGREQGAVAEVHSKLSCMKSPGLGPAPSLALSPLRPETQQGGLLCPPQRLALSSAGESGRQG